MGGKIFGRMSKIMKFRSKEFRDHLTLNILYLTPAYKESPFTRRRSLCRNDKIVHTTLSILFIFVQFVNVKTCFQLPI